jgi:tetratricopeptide (TPR) repeat protein
MTTRRIVSLALLAASLALTACSGGGPRAIHMIEQSGDRALEKGDTQLAEAEYAEVVQREPARWRARLQYGKALLANGNARMAREQLEVAYTLRPKNPEVIENLGMAMAGSRDYDGAIRLLGSLAEERKRAADWTRLGRVALDAKDVDTAERAFLTAALADGGQRAEYQMELYNFYMATERPEEAIERLRYALWLEPANKVYQGLALEAGHDPAIGFAQRPPEQTSTRIPEPFFPRPAAGTR